MWYRAVITGLRQSRPGQAGRQAALQAVRQAVRQAGVMMPVIMTLIADHTTVDPPAAVRPI